LSRICFWPLRQHYFSSSKMPGCTRPLLDLSIDVFGSLKKPALSGTLKKMQLPSYSVRQSERAKNLRLKVTPRDGLCVVIPRGFDETRIRGILKKKKRWI